MTSNPIPQIAADYRSATAFFLEAAAEISERTLDLKHPNGWSARQVIHHMADSEAQSYARLRRLLAEPAGSIIQGYDEGAWAICRALGYSELPIENSLAVFAAVRAASADVLERMQQHDLERMGTHSESGPYGIRNWIASYTNHPREHAEQMRKAQRGEP